MGVVNGLCDGNSGRQRAVYARKEIRSRDDFVILMVITKSRMPKYTGYGVLEDVGVWNIWLHHEGSSWRVLLVDLREENLHNDSDN